MLGEFERIILLFYLLKPSENVWFFDRFREGVELNLFAWTRFILDAKSGNGF